MGEGTYFTLDDAATHRQSSFLGELGLNASYQLSRHCSLSGGYEVMWIDNVALAADSVASIQRSDDSFWHGGAFYHGALAGVTFTW